jgi:hypothetical protein
MEYSLSKNSLVKALKYMTPALTKPQPNLLKGKNLIPE